MAQDRIISRYWIETPRSLEAAAEVMAGASTGTFVKVPGLTSELRDRCGGRVERIVPGETTATPSLPGATPAGEASSPLRYQRGEVVLSFPVEGTGTNLPAIISSLLGNFFAFSQVSGMRLLDVEFPRCFASAYPGPGFGIQGTRRLTGVSDRPIIGTIIKPNTGLSPEQTAEMVRSVADAGVDFIKDDEAMADPPHSPLRKRVPAVMRVINEHADRTGKKVMYAFNIGDECDAMYRHHDLVLAAGGTCVMISINSIGYMGALALRRRSQLPIHGHRNGWDMLTRCPHLGMEFRAYQKLWRLIGVDHLHVNGLRNKFWESDDSVVSSIRATMEPMLGGYHVIPVIGSGQWAGQVVDTVRRTGLRDFIYLSGGGIFGHPGGAAAGVESIRQAWQAAEAGIALESYAATHPELQQAIDRFGKPGGAQSA